MICTWTGLHNETEDLLSFLDLHQAVSQGIAMKLKTQN